MYQCGSHSMLLTSMTPVGGWAIMWSQNKKETCSREWFRSIDLWVMGPARSHCANFKNKYRHGMCYIFTPTGGGNTSCDVCTFQITALNDAGTSDPSDQEPPLIKSSGRHSLVNTENGLKLNVTFDVSITYTCSWSLHYYALFNRQSLSVQSIQ